jgi:hypothetical protein
MNSKARHKQFMLESNILHQSTNWAIDRAEYLNERCWNLTAEESIEQGPEMLEELNYFEQRLALEERLLDSHMEKYKDLITDE